MPINPSWAQGIDIYEGNGVFNPSKAVERIDFVIAQSNRGLYLDKRFAANYETSRAHNIPFMAYNQAQSRIDWKRQSDIMLGAVLGKDVLGLWWAYDGAGGNTLSAQFAKDSVSAMRYLREHTGKLVGVYGNRNEIAQLYKDAPEVREFSLWLANYRSTSVANIAYWETTPNVMPITAPQFPNGLPWIIWQYAYERNWLGFDTGPRWGLESHSVDINCWRGAPAEMRAFLGLYGGNSNPDDSAELRENPELKSHLRRLEQLEAWARSRGYKG